VPRLLEARPRAVRGLGGVAVANVELDGLEPLRLRLARVVDVEIVEEAAGDVAAGRAESRTVRVIIGARDDEQKLGEGKVGGDGRAVR
jgi:hypothetical protein